MGIWCTKLLIMHFFTIFAVSLYAVIPEMEVWTDGVHYRYLLKDYARDYKDGRVTKQQHNDILLMLRQLVPDVFIIVEDPNVYNGTNTKIQALYAGIFSKTIEQWIAQVQTLHNVNPAEVQGSCEFFKNNCIYPIMGMSHSCAKYGIPYYNAVEGGQAILAYNAGELVIQYAGKRVTKYEVVKELSDQINKMAVHNELSDHYYFLIDKLNNIKKTARTDHRMQFVEEVNDIGVFLLWANTLHQLIEWKVVKHGFICQRSHYIERLKGHLKTLGYKHVKTFGKYAQGLSTDENYTQSILDNALNFGEVFTQIFKKQEKKKAEEEDPKTFIGYLRYIGFPISETISLTVGACLGCLLYINRSTLKKILNS
jgi:hypothetical protein